MEIKKFENGLIIKSRKSAIIFEANVNEKQGYGFTFSFTKESFREFAEYIEEIANKSWSNISPKEAQSEASDYFEYYDKELDNNGYLRIGYLRTGNNELLIDRPDLECDRLYQFNKRKLESFLYDLQKKILV